MLHKIMEIVLFSANVHHCIIAYSIVQVEVCFESFLFIIMFSFLAPKLAANFLFCANGKQQMYTRY